MKLSQLFVSIASLSLSAASLAAEPICPEMLNEASLEKRYKRLAPIYNDARTGWIFGSDQFDQNYALDKTEEQLLAQIVDAFAERGSKLAIMIAPPRPVVAGQSVVDETTGVVGQFDVSAQAASFQTLIAQLQSAGAIAPDLLSLATTASALRDDFYFARDTHWTSIGAAASALALAHAVGENAPAFEIDDLDHVEKFTERGSLSDIVRATCDLDPKGEETPVFDYAPYLPSSGGLLDDTPSAAPEAVLLGTSFSDRYKRDQYQVADALTAALGMTFANYSVSGGGMIGPIESYVLSGQLEADSPELIVWEFPYTYQLRQTQLRQLLGALRSNTAISSTTQKDVSDGKVVLEIKPNAQSVGIKPIGAAPLKLSAKLRLNDGSTVKLSLTRKKRIQEAFGNKVWWIDLSLLALQADSLEIKFRSSENPMAIEVYFPESSG